jgi:hypothetical protein
METDPVSEAFSLEYQRTDKVQKKEAVPRVIYHRQNPLESTRINPECSWSPWTRDIPRTDSLSCKFSGTVWKFSSKTAVHDIKPLLQLLTPATENVISAQDITVSTYQNFNKAKETYREIPLTQSLRTRIIFLYLKTTSIHPQPRRTDVLLYFLILVALKKFTKNTVF